MKHLKKQKYFGHDCLEPKIQLFVIKSFLSCFVVVVIVVVVVVLVFCFSFANTHLTILWAQSFNKIKKKDINVPRSSSGILFTG